jgi:hypothetical protein
MAWSARKHGRTRRHALAARPAPPRCRCARTARRRGGAIHGCLRGARRASDAATNRETTCAKHPGARRDGRRFDATPRRTAPTRRRGARTSGRARSTSPARANRPPSRKNGRARGVGRDRRRGRPADFACARACARIHEVSPRGRPPQRHAGGGTRRSPRRNGRRSAGTARHEASAPKPGRVPPVTRRAARAPLCDAARPCDTDPCHREKCLALTRQSKD